MKRRTAFLICIFTLVFLEGYVFAAVRFYNACQKDKYTVHICRDALRRIWDLPL